jgi:hypothetical protein
MRTTILIQALPQLFSSVMESTELPADRRLLQPEVLRPPRLAQLRPTPLAILLQHLQALPPRLILEA